MFCVNLNYSLGSFGWQIDNHWSIFIIWKSWLMAKCSINGLTVFMYRAGHLLSITDQRHVRIWPMGTRWQSCNGNQYTCIYHSVTLVMAGMEWLLFWIFNLGFPIHVYHVMLILPSMSSVRLIACEFSPTLVTNFGIWIIIMKRVADISNIDRWLAKLKTNFQGLFFTNLIVSGLWVITSGFVIVTLEIWKNKGGLCKNDQSKLSLSLPSPYFCFHHKVLSSRMHMWD